MGATPSTVLKEEHFSTYYKVISNIFILIKKFCGQFINGPDSSFTGRFPCTEQMS